MSEYAGMPDYSDAKKLAADYQASLSKFKFDQETQRDKTLGLTSGGALTVSFAFISMLVQHGPITQLWSLISAWVFWVGVLIGTVFGYSLSISNYGHVIQALSEGQWEPYRISRSALIIEPLNNLVAVMAVCGFMLFGYFAIINLTRISNEKATAQQTEVGQ